jgi:peptide/nickel transport system ATP-binding protein
VSGLSVDYTSSRGEVIPALREISLELERQQVLGVLGESGSGKSSLSHAILRLLPGNAKVVEGTVEYSGRNLLTLPDRELRRVRGAGIALIAQEPALALNPVLSIGRQIIDVLRAHRRLSHQVAKEQARSMLREVGFTAPDRILSAYPHQLSGGQRQRAAIAQALMCSPELLIADEPLSSLDTITQAEILELLQKLKRDFRLALIFVTHNAGVLSALADRVMVLVGGRVRAQGTLRQLSAESDSHVRRLIFAENALRQEDTGREKRADPQPMVEVRNVSKQYVQRRLFTRHRFAVQALQGLDFEIAEGSSTAIIGRSGSGKTTLARCIAGFEVPDSGEVRIAGADPKHQRRQVQLIFQDAGTALNPRFTAAEVIIEPLDIGGQLASPHKKQRALQLMEEVGLDPEWHLRKAGEFSGGQRQRLALARALAPSPRLLILDESLSGLDLPLQAQILRLLLDLQSRHGLTYLHITHDLNFLPLFADSVLVMDAGKIVEACSPSSLLKSPHPATRALVEASERLHIPGLETVR